MYIYWFIYIYTGMYAWSFLLVYLVSDTSVNECLFVLILKDILILDSSLSIS